METVVSDGLSQIQSKTVADCVQAHTEYDVTELY